MKTFVFFWRTSHAADFISGAQPESADLALGNINIKIIVRKETRPQVSVAVGHDIQYPGEFFRRDIAITV